MGKDDVSIREISKLTGVSIATVSRVINQNGRFSRETEEKVRKALEETGYTPNLAARSLRTKRIPTVGVIVPDITNEFFARITLELQNRLFDFNYSTIICNTNEINDIEQRHLLMLRSQQVSGIVYISGAFSGDREILDLPTVYIDRKPPFTSEHKDYLLIESDNFDGGYIAGREMRDEGCQRLCMIKYKNEISSHNDREAGFLKAVHERGIDLLPGSILTVNDVSVESGYRATMELINGIKPDGIFCSTDLLAVGAINALLESGLKVPEAVKVVGFDDTSIAANSRIPITSLQQPIQEIGRLAAQNIVNMMESPQEQDGRQIKLPVKLIKRSST